MAGAGGTPIVRVLDRAITALLRDGESPQRVACALAVDISTVARRKTALTLRDLAPRDPRHPLTGEQETKIVALYCQSAPPPGMLRWTLRTAARHINAHLELLGRSVHATTIGRVLRRNRLRPHRVRYFLHVRDPKFFEKMRHVLEVYAKKCDYIFCFDECPNLQAISRNGPDVPQSNGSNAREFVYQRNGTTDVFGFLRVSTGTVAAYCRPSHETATLIEVFTAHVQAQPKHEQLHYICDNLFPHFNADFCNAVAQLCGLPPPSPTSLANGRKRRDWLQREDKRIVVHFLPFHGSWLNQVEIWFGLLKRYALDGGWFQSVPALIDSIIAFTNTWNEHLAHPFRFRYTGQDLENVVLRRFTKVLSQPSQRLQLLDTKFLADMSLLCARIVTAHRHNLNANNWNAFAEIVTTRASELLDVIAADPGPRRRPHAQKAFQSLCLLAAHIKLPRTGAPQPAAHH